MAITDDQYETLIEELQKNRKLSEDIQRNWNLDREDFNNFKNRLGHLEIEVSNFKEVINKLPENVKFIVLDSLKSISKDTQKLTRIIEKKKMIAIPEKELKKKPWWRWR